MDQYPAIITVLLLEKCVSETQKQLSKTKANTKSKVASAFVLIVKGFYHRSANFVSGV